MYLKANINTKFELVRYGMVRFLLFSEYYSCSREEIFSDNKRKRYHTTVSDATFPEWIFALIFSFITKVYLYNYE